MRWPEVRRLARYYWARLRGWWLLSGAAVVAALLSAAGHRYSGLGAGLVIAVGGAVAGVLADRGRARLAAASPTGARPAVQRVDRLVDPVRLGVHPAEALERDGIADRVPPFVPRDRLPEVESALREGGFLLVTGDSTAGKTRLAFEAMRRALPRHVCVDPRGPDGLAPAVAAAQQRRPSVLWLDDLERYLGPGGLTPVAAAELLDAPRGDVVILATIRSHERDGLSHRYDAERHVGDQQLARAGRELLAAVTREVRLDRLWSDGELARAQQFRHDRRIAEALDSVDRHGIAELLAAGPRLLDALRDAWAVGPRTRAAALVTAAVDVRRTGYHRPFPLDALRILHERYLREAGGSALRPGPWKDAVRWATQPLYGTSSLLEPTDGDGYLAFDYLVDVAARDPDRPPVPDHTWLAVLDHAEPNDLVEVAWQASLAGHIDPVLSAFDKAMRARAHLAAAGIAYCLGEAGHEDEAVARLEAVVAAAQDDPAVSPADLLRMRLGIAWHLGEKYGGQGRPDLALPLLRDLVLKAEAILGEHHPDTLQGRKLLARQVGAVGDPVGALAIATELVTLAGKHLGAKHEEVLSARFEAAVWTREVHGAAAGAAAFRALADDIEAGAPDSWQNLVDSWWNLAGCLLDSNDPAAARDVAYRAVDKAVETYGARHVRTLLIRTTLVDATGAAGNPALAGQLASALLRDSIQTMGDTHPATLAVRATAERWPPP
jgi:eukaryotic-like serine/threonine-protein kinase